jgi:hypothetical protein
VLFTCQIPAKFLVLLKLYRTFHTHIYCIKVQTLCGRIWCILAIKDRHFVRSGEGLRDLPYAFLYIFLSFLAVVETFQLADPSLMRFLYSPHFHRQRSRFVLWRVRFGILSKMYVDRKTNLLGRFCMLCCLAVHLLFYISLNKYPTTSQIMNIE